MIINGKIKKPIGGEERLFWFNANVMIDLATDAGIPQDDREGVEKTYKLFESNWMMTLRKVFYYSLQNSENKLPDNFNERMCGEWISNMEFDDFNEVVSVMSKSISWGQKEPEETEEKKS